MAEKIKISSSLTPYPMPLVLIGAEVDGKPNFLAAAWIAKVNYEPAMVAVALGGEHYTNQGILTNKCFSVNVPSIGLIEKTDYCGLVSGKKTDKSEVFDVFYGGLKAPMIRECPVTMECELTQTVELPEDKLFIGLVKGVYSEERFLTGGKPDPRKLRPFIYSSGDKNYWSLGEVVGKAYSDGKKRIASKG